MHNDCSVMDLEKRSEILKGKVTVNCISKGLEERCKLPQQDPDD